MIVTIFNILWRSHIVQGRVSVLGTSYSTVVKHKFLKCELCSGMISFHTLTTPLCHIFALAPAIKRCFSLLLVVVTDEHNI